MEPMTWKVEREHVPTYTANWIGRAWTWDCSCGATDKKGYHLHPDAVTADWRAHVKQQAWYLADRLRDDPAYLKAALHDHRLAGTVQRPVYVRGATRTHTVMTWKCRCGILGQPTSRFQLSPARLKQNHAAHRRAAARADIEAQRAALKEM